MEKSSKHKSGSKRSSKSRESSEQKFKDSSKRKAVEQEDSDGEENPLSLAEAKRPAPKTVKKPRISLQSNDGNSDFEESRTKLQTNDEGERYVDLGKKKRATVRTFKGMTLVDIREYYGTEGDEKPGKKGISLTVEQWETLVQASGAISGLL
ncbi:transcriptional Coactivator p15-domain-containing protein [Russula earlei]|uniref:Transcriptional Coactivator p15-domain-containing protein n=1 Tax=Russula earlei TaxID=71964 RepID=A0ACC0UHU8_9AGAM|nr:transcriptional Coactivator p15-domain-containing protein [Russula earlei]